MKSTTEQTQGLYKEEIYSAKPVFSADILCDLQKRGFTYIFEFSENCICCKDFNISLNDFEIVEVHSFETTALREGCNVYAINCDKYNIKGILVNTVTTYANVFSSVCINKVLNNNHFEFKHYNNNNQLT